jgi:hypothetical protein
MPVLGVLEVLSTGVASQDQVGVRKYLKIFLVQMSNLTAMPLEVTSTPLIPRRFAFYVGANGERDRGSIVRDYDVERVADSGFWWTVKVHYSNDRSSGRRISEDPHQYNMGGQDTGDPKETNPLQRPPDISYSGAKFKRVLERDRNGKPYVNLVGEKYSNPLEADDTRLILTIVRNEGAYSPQQAMNFLDVTNSAPVQIAGQLYDTGVLKCDAFYGVSQTEMGQFFWKVTYAFSIRFRDQNDVGGPWDYTTLEMSTSGMTTDGTRYLFFDKKNAAFFSAPVAIYKTGNGKEVAIVDGTQANPPYTYTAYRVCYRADFNVLNLPT